MSEGNSAHGPEGALIEAALAGDAAAMDGLAERHQAQLYRFSLRMCRHPEDAEDVVQETLLKMAQRLGEFRGASSLSTWLYAIARSHCAKRRRRSKFAPAPDLPLDEASRAGVEDPSPGPDERLASREVRRLFEDAIDALPLRDREVLVLRDVEGLSASEVGAVVGTSVAAVKSRLHRARRAVRRRLEPLLSTPPGAGAATDGRCPDTATLFSRYLEGELTPSRCAEMERHLEQCGGCRSTCEGLKESLALCRATPLPEVPEHVQESVRRAFRGFLEKKP